MTKLYQIDVRICGTVYVKGKNKQEALVALHDFITENKCLDVRGDGISGLMFDDPKLPKCSLSPAMTLCDIWPDSVLEEAS